jgi:hypothetical protein
MSAKTGRGLGRRLVLAVALASGGAVVPIGPPAFVQAAGELVPQAGAGVQIYGDVVAAVTSPGVDVVFRNASGADVVIDTVSFGSVDPADLTAGSAVANQIAAAGVDPATIVDPGGLTQGSTTCTGTIAAGQTCGLSVSTPAWQRPVAGTISISEAGTQAEIGKAVVVWVPVVPGNDNWANATDVSSLTIPPFDGTFTGAAVTGSTIGATQEAAEPAVIDGFGNPWTLGTVWYRYESPPGGFSGLLGFEMSSNAFIVTPYAAYETDPFNPFLGLYPDEGPGALERMAYAPTYTVRRDLPGGAFYEATVARVEPGQKVWFQVVPNPAYPGAAPGEFSFRLYHVNDVAEQIATAPDPFCGLPCGPLSTFSVFGYADTFASSPQPAGPASAWSTFEVASTGTFAVTAQSQKASRRESERPLNIELYRAPSSAAVTDPSQLGAPIASNAGRLVPGVTWLNGQFTPVQQWVTEVTGQVVTPGRYYVRLSGTPTFASLWQRLTATSLTPPTITISAPPAGAAYSSPADVPALAFSCTPVNSTVASTTVTVDGLALNAGDPLPTSAGTHNIVVGCTDSNGTSASASSSYSVAAPVTAPNRTVTTQEDAAAVIDLVAPVVAPAGVTVTVESAGGAAHGTLSVGSTGVTYTPAANYFGPDSFTYTVVGSNGQRSTANVSVTVTPVNDAPVAVADALSVAAGSTLDVLGTTLVGNDTDIDGAALTATSLTRAGGTVTGQLAACVPARADCWRYVAPTSAGTELFDYTVSDGNGGTTTGRLTITVLPAALPDTLLVTLRCPSGFSYSIGGATTGLTVSRGPFGITIISGVARVGTAEVRIGLLVAAGGASLGSVRVVDGSFFTMLYPRSAGIAIGTTWVTTGTYWRQVDASGTRFERCTFQVNVTDGG